MRCDPLPRYRRADEQHDLSLPDLPTCRSFAVVAWVTFPRAQFHLVQGRPSEFHSSEPVRRTFCADCGTPLTYEHRDNVGFVDITTCSLDKPESFPPTHHSWLSHDLAWVRFGDGLPTFQESRHDSAA